MPAHGQTIKQLVRLGDAETDCWAWLGSINKTTGYGKKTMNSDTKLAHRWIWEQLFGAIPSGMVINHRCGNRSCVNPHHLEVTTQSENCRHGKGATLTSEQALDIYSQKAGKRWGLGASLAKQYGVTSSLVHDIWNGRAWCDITGEEPKR